METALQWELICQTGKTVSLYYNEIEKCINIARFMLPIFENFFEFVMEKKQEEYARYEVKFLQN